MTVIAYKDGIMASDSLMAEDDGTIYSNIQKLFRFANNEVIGIAGDVRKCMAFLDWYDGGYSIEDWKVSDDKEDEFYALVAHSNGSVQLYDSSVNPINMNGDFFAIGSGAASAMALMKVGYSAEEAATMTCDLNVFCRPPIQIEKIHEIEEE